MSQTQETPILYAKSPLMNRLTPSLAVYKCFFFFQAEDGIRDHCVTGVQTCALPISESAQPRLCCRRDRGDRGPEQGGARLVSRRLSLTPARVPRRSMKEEPWKNRQTAAVS